MSSYPPGAYEILIQGEISGFPGSAVAHTYTLILEDPCESTVITIASVPDFEIVIGEAAQTH